MNKQPIDMKLFLLNTGMRKYKRPNVIIVSNKLV